MLQILNMEHGRGVFTDKAIGKGEVIEECPIVPLSLKDSELCGNTILDTYMFPWGTGGCRCVLGGFGMFYNHNDQPNAETLENHTQKSVIIRALRTIAAGEEITHDYTEGTGLEIVFEGDAWHFADGSVKTN